MIRSESGVARCLDHSCQCNYEYIYNRTTRDVCRSELGEVTNTDFFQTKLLSVPHSRNLRVPHLFL